MHSDKKKLVKNSVSEKKKKTKRKIESKVTFINSLYAADWFYIRILLKECLILPWITQSFPQNKI